MVERKELATLLGRKLNARPGWKREGGGHEGPEAEKGEDFRINMAVARNTYS